MYREVCLEENIAMANLNLKASYKEYKITLYLFNTCVGFESFMLKG
jgi:hypothetical protein